MDQPGTYLPFTDTYISSVTDIEECRAQCSSQGQYNCRSFNYNAFRKECFLSADDAVSLPTGLQTDRDFTFSERSGCNSGNRLRLKSGRMFLHEFGPVAGDREGGGIGGRGTLVSIDREQDV